MGKYLYQITFYIVCVGSILVLCFRPTVHPEASGEVRDFLGRAIQAPSMKPVRIVSLSPSNTEILFALGAGDHIVGVTNYCDFPPEAKKAAKVGGFQNPDVETIVMMRPDIVFAGGNFQHETIERLERLGINVVAIEPQSMNEILKAIQLISSLIGEQTKGEWLIAELKQIAEKVQMSKVQNQTPRVFLEIWDVPFISVGGKSYITDIVKQAGGINVASVQNADWVVCDYETLYMYNPDIYIVVRHAGISVRDFQRTEFQAIRAIRDNKIFYISDDLLARPGPRSFTALEQIASILKQQ